jgi:uncharacterized protein YoaH (UPF0181 family)
MSDTGAADNFLRHRGAVLDAVLSDPTLSNSIQGEPDSPVAETGGGGVVGEGARASDRIRELLDGGLSSGSAVDQVLFADRTVRRRNAEPDDHTDADINGLLSLPDPPRTRPRRFGRFGEAVGALSRNRGALVLAGACALVIAVLVAVFVTIGGDDDPQDAKAPVATPSAPASVPAAPPAPSAAAPVGVPIQVKSATTQCPAGSTDGMDAFSAEDGKAWSCVRAFNVDGQVMTIDLGKQYKIDSIGIVPGFDYIAPDGTDEWDQHRTASRVSYEFDDSDRTTYTQDTMDQRTSVVTKIEPPIATSQIVLTVLKSNGNRSADDVAISSIVITGQ